MSHFHTWTVSRLDARYERCFVCKDVRLAGSKPVELDAFKAREARDEAVEIVEVYADLNWKQKAYRMGVSIAEDLTEFTADDFWARGLSKPREPRALGPVLNALQRDCVIVSTDRLKQTDQVLRHAAPVRIWRSLLRKARSA